MTGEVHVVVVGQTPPPWGGQAVMIQAMLDADYEGVRLHRVRMNFSREMSEIGRFRWTKLAHLASVVARIVVARIRWRAAVLYYPPAGHQRLAVARDALILASTRWMFQATILHFHAAGLSELYEELGPAIRPGFRWAFFRPTVGVRMSSLAPNDPAGVNAWRTCIVPYGIADTAHQGKKRTMSRPALADRTRRQSILYVGILHESKGIFVLIEACRLLQQRGIDFHLDLVGAFTSNEVRDRLFDALAASELAGRTTLHGVLTGADKERVYAEADIFCLPTRFEAESFPVVLLEALRAGLPVVATSWRAIPDIVTDGENGRLVPVCDPAALAEGLGQLLADPMTAARMGKAGRARYEARYGLERFRSGMQDVFDITVETAVAKGSGRQ